MRWTALTIIPLVLLVGILLRIPGPVSQALRPVLDEAKGLLGKNTAVFSTPDFGTVSLWRRLTPHARRTKGNPQTRVWVNTRSGLYYCPGTQLYGRINPGLYMAQTTALQRRFQPALAKPCL